MPRMPAPYVEDAPVINSKIPYILIVPHVESLGIKYFHQKKSIMWQSLPVMNAEKKKTEEKISLRLL